VFCTRPPSASLTVSSGFKIYSQHLSGVLLFSQVLVSRLPALKSMKVADFSGSMPLQRDGVMFAISECLLYPVVAARASTFAILIQAGGLQPPVVPPDGCWVLTIVRMTMAAFPGEAFISRLRGTAETHHHGSERKEQSVALEGQRGCCRWKQVMQTISPSAG